MPKMIAPSSHLLQIKIDAAMAAFDAHRKRVLADRFERATAFNRSRARERHEANLVRMPRSSAREHMGRRNVYIRQVRGGYISEHIEMTFLGRSSHEGARSGLRALCSYIADNATVPTSAIEIRRLFALVMDGQRHALTAI